jgi:glycosyltransferase involved in cell wall biosynthesis
MRVALISPGYAPAVGGVETAVTALSRGLADAGCDVEVWTTAGNDAPGIEEVRGIRVLRHASYGPRRYPAAPALWRHTSRQATSVDLVHAHSFHATASLGLLSPRTPYVFSPHYHGVGHTAVARGLHRLYRPIGRRLLRGAQELIAVSGAERDLLVQDAPELDGRITVVHHGVDCERIQAADPFPETRPVLLVLGRLEQYKRVDQVLRAFDSCRAGGRLVIAGEGPDRLRLEGLAAQGRRAEDVQFLGRIPDGEVARWLRTATAVVSLSEHEAFGLVALEGVAAGATAVLSDIPAHREVAGLARGRTVLVPVHDSAVLRGQLERLLLGTRGEPVGLRTWADVASAHLAVYERALAGQRTTMSS